MSRGVDFAWHPSGRPSLAALRAEGVTWVARYTNAAADSKRLSAEEVSRLVPAGLGIVLVYESTADFMRGGRAAGVLAAQRSLAQADAAGLTALGSGGLYLAADWDVQPGAEQDAVHACLEGARSVLGPGRVGIYGGYFTITRAVAYWAQAHPGEQLYTWQTGAWSYGHVWAGQDIHQGHQQTIDGVDCDTNIAYSVDFGQWPSVTQEDDMPLTDADARTLWLRKTHDGADAPTAQEQLNVAAEAATRIEAKLAALAASVAGLSDDEAHILAAIKNGPAANVDVDALAAALSATLAPDVVRALGAALITP